MKQQMLEEEVKHLNKIIDVERLNNVRLIKEKERLEKVVADQAKDLTELRLELRSVLDDKAELEHRLDSLSH